jgi:shikimate dehydrogenase
MRHFGIIGYPLLHSFSAKYFNEKFQKEQIEAEYSLYPIVENELEQVRELLDRLDGMNITLPYKQTIIPYLKGLDETAETIGAVNVVHNHIGYNTDCLGFMESIHPLLRPYDKKALVLGTGGAAKAICYGLTKLQIEPTLVSRTPHEQAIGYDAIDQSIMDTHSIIINCTPLGMLPDIESCPNIPYEMITNRHLLFDCIYNPEETLFLKKGRLQGASTQNGMRMLIGQANAAWKIWNKE